MNIVKKRQNIKGNCQPFTSVARKSCKSPFDRTGLKMSSIGIFMVRRSSSPYERKFAAIESLPPSRKDAYSMTGNKKVSSSREL
jgi:hypothetical protein